jgi:hypothetical protein
MGRCEGGALGMLAAYPNTRQTVESERLGAGTELPGS